MHFARTSRTTTVAPFDPPTPVPEIEIGSSNADPMVSPDELVVAFSTDLTGNSDIYYARRGSTAVPFATPTPIPSIDDPSFHDADPNLSNDGCELLFSSDRSGGTELYSAIVH